MHWPFLILACVFLPVLPDTIFPVIVTVCADSDQKIIMTSRPYHPFFNLVLSPVVLICFTDVRIVFVAVYTNKTHENITSQHW